MMVLAARGAPARSAATPRRRIPTRTAFFFFFLLLLFLLFFFFFLGDSLRRSFGFFAAPESKSPLFKWESHGG